MEKQQFNKQNQQKNDIEIEDQNQKSEETKYDANFIDCSNLSIEKLLEIANDHFEKLNLDNAEYFYEEACKKDENNEIALTSYADFLKHQCEHDKAQYLYKRAIQINPNSNYKKFFQLAEIQQGQESLDLYERGIYILSSLTNQQDQDEEMKKDLADAYSAQAEIYQTDFIHLKESEIKCTQCIQKALDIDPECLDAYLQLANYQLNKENESSAKEILDKIYTKLEQIDDDKDYYTDSFKLSTIKLYIEVEEYQKPIKILEKLHKQDENNAEVIYLLSFCHFKLLNLYTSLELIEDCLKQDLQDDEELLTASKELKSELDKVDFTLAKDGQDYIDKELNDECEEWMDVEDN